MQLDLDALLERIPSKYEMVVAAARRARQLVDGAPKLVETRSQKPVSAALEEILHGKLEYRVPPRP
ncbi:MAG TPA: DNA-directed RNA polymerase subunit omega [Bacillota bacterium]